MRWLHGSLVAFWVVVTVPGVLFWKESILFVILLSLYANIEVSFAAYLSSKKKPVLEKRRPKLFYKGPSIRIKSDTQRKARDQSLEV